MRDRITVQEAARRLGVKDDAIRKRIQRGSIEHDKGPDGRVFVYLDATHDESQDSYKNSTQYTSQDGNNGSTHDTAHDSSYAVLVELLRSELEDWKQVVATRDEELRRKDSIIAALAQRIPELEAPSESRDGREMASPPSDRNTGYGDDQKPAKRRSWLHRFFGIE